MNSIFDLVSDSVFDLPNPSPLTKLVKKCMPYTEDEKNLTRWQVKNPRTDEFDLELPKCVFVCEEEPPFDNKIYNRTWRDGFKGEGEIAKYRCLGKEKKIILPRKSPAHCSKGGAKVKINVFKGAVQLFDMCHILHGS